MDKHQIPIRTQSEATYIKRNPDGDPFRLVMPRNSDEAKLFGLGLGLYWGEGTKANKNSIRLGNTDPGIIINFIRFLEKFFSIRKKDLKFGLQIFSDVNPQEALDFWIKRLKIKNSQLNKPIITKSRSLGTYRKKSKYGVMTVMFHNKKSRDALIKLLPM
ncbi:MAG: hypothetical protein KGI60_02330 [Patescibacteria group bacterium]|nr:hypothetical protein [Patescibacteria group bacterium]